MLPLSPPPGYFKEINSIISKFIWNYTCPRIKLTTLQHPNSAGGLAVPNFELYLHLCIWQTLLSKATYSAFRLYIFFYQYSMCVPWESNPQPFALLTQCSTTEPQEHRRVIDIIGHSSLRLFIIGLILNLQFHGG